MGLLASSLSLFSTETETQYVEQLKKLPQFKNAKIALHVMDENGQMKMTYQSDELLHGRSISKMITTAAALSVLGEKYQFVTELYTQGSIKNRILEGSLIIKAGGDPTLGSYRYKADSALDLNSFVEAIVALDLTQIEGDLILDASSFETAFANRFWEIEDVGNYYGAGSCALNYADNFYSISFDTSKEVNGKAEIKLIKPRLDGVALKNEVKIAAATTSDEAYVFGGEYAKMQVIRGTLPKSSYLQTIKAAIPNPPLFFLEELRKALDTKGIEFHGNLLVVDEPVDLKNSTLQCSHYSPECFSIVKETNKASDNLYSEALMKQMGLKRFGLGSTESGIKSIEEYLVRLGVPLDSIILKDGSGLSKRNLVSAKSFCSFLLKAQKESCFNTWKSTLLQNKDLKAFAISSIDKGNFYVKTGTSKENKAIAGYYEPVNGKRLIFTLMIESQQADAFSKNQAIEKFLALLLNLK